MKRKIKILISILLFSLLSVYGQQATRIDTIEYVQFDGQTNFTIQGKDTVCLSNGKPFSIKEYLRVEKLNCRLNGDCRNMVDHTFYVHTFSLSGQLLFSTYRIDPEQLFFGSYKEYYTDGKLKIEGQYAFFGNDWKMYLDEKNWNKKIGIWKYYNKKGRLKCTETFTSQ